MKRGQTIVAERERVESDSERMRARKKLHRRHLWSVLSVLMMLGILGYLGYMTVREAIAEKTGKIEKPRTEYEVTVPVIDEDGKGQISARMKEYIGRLEKDFQDLGYTVRQVTLPTGTSRELFVDLVGKEAYFKVSMDRDSAVSAEDAVRMLRYLEERELKAEYVDVRLEGKAYFRAL